MLKNFLRYKVLYFIESIFYNCIYRLFLWKKPKYDKKYRISIIGIFWNEGPFLKEWIEYHLMIGVDHFYLYNHKSDDNFQEILQPYIDRGLITLVLWEEEHSQMKAYQDCIDRFKHETQWMVFLDLDEFICPRNTSDINLWIKDYERYPSILIYWKMFGTSGVMKHDYNKLVIEQYKMCMEGYLGIRGKCIFNTDYEISNYTFVTHHYTCVNHKILGFNIRVVPISVFKKFIVGTLAYHFLENPKKASAHIHHYWSKAWDQYEIKMNRVDVAHKENPLKDLQYFYDVEEYCTEEELSMFKYITKLKLKLANKI